MGARSGRAHRRPAALRGAARRASALALAAALLLGLVAPVAAALAIDESGPACCRGRCCCRGSLPSDEPCLRAACHCDRDRHALVPELEWPDAVVTRRPSLAAPAPAPAPRAAPAAGASTLARPVPHPPPRLRAEIPSAA